MDLESKKRMASAYLNKAISFYDELNKLKKKILSEEASIEGDSLSNLQRKEELLIRAGSINEIQKVLNESVLVTYEFVSTLVDIELGDINRKIWNTV